ncbi:MAG: type I polyketide synthase [Desulfuromonadales bacterium]|nr:type I polyketide synthase [Desulfuromonadales bacterium]
MGFSQLRALSKRGICSPFDAAGDGLVVGEGAGIFMLKRTEDAITHGDRIYGIIRAVGLSNDVGGSLLAPMSEGQLRAMKDAYTKAEWKPEDVDIIECHATGTPVGDATEFSTMEKLWEGSSGENRCVIGSVKSNIGHLLTAAGAAALTKIILSAQKGVFPPTANFTKPQPGINLDKSRFRILTNHEKWNQREEGIPRRAGISAFGFGGINAHLLFEEWLPDSAKLYKKTVSKKPTPKTTDIAVIGIDSTLSSWKTTSDMKRHLFTGENHIVPTEPNKWWEAEKTDWFKKEGLGSTPFIGHYMDEISIPSNKFRIPPLEIEEMLPQQLLMLKSAANAIADAKIDEQDNKKTGVFIGIAFDLNSTNFSYRWTLPSKAEKWNKELELGFDGENLESWVLSLKDELSPPLTANRTMGALGNIVASRIAREFRCGGPSFTLSSEETSGARALETAISLLEKGEINKAVVGAVDLAGDIRAVLGHNALKPFSQKGAARPFGADADGAIIGEGAATVILKRLEDAKQEGDRIYAVIKGIGISSSKYIAPEAEAYTRAINDAHSQAGITPDRIGYIEANAAGYAPEDITESEALAEIWNKSNVAKRSCALAAIKGETGNTGAASSIISLVRGCMALYYETIPGLQSISESSPNQAVSEQFYIPESSRYWLHNRVEGLRIAAASSAGIDGSCCHIILEEHESNERNRIDTWQRSEYGKEALFILQGNSNEQLKEEIGKLNETVKSSDQSINYLASELISAMKKEGLPQTIAIIAKDKSEFLQLLERAEKQVTGENHIPTMLPQLRDRLFYTASPLGKDAKIAFLFPGSGNHFPEMSMDISMRWPQIFREQEKENLFLKSQFQPELFWNGASSEEINNDYRGVIFGQVTNGSATSDIVRSFGINPEAVIGYSLGETAGLFAMKAWKNRDGMLKRMYGSSLFIHDLAGECRAAAKHWNLPEGKKVDWLTGVVNAPAKEVRRAIKMAQNVYLLIVNTYHESVIGGEAKNIKRLVAMLGADFIPLNGVTTVHCEVVKEVAKAYRDLHLLPTSPPEEIKFYSGAGGTSYELNEESAADSILAQAIEGIDYPQVIQTAYDGGIRVFLEMGPGTSCTRMVSSILKNKEHIARSASSTSMDSESSILRLIGHMASENIPVDLSQLIIKEEIEVLTVSSKTIVVKTGGKAFNPSLLSVEPVITKPEEKIEGPEELLKPIDAIHIKETPQFEAKTATKPLEYPNVNSISKNPVNPSEAAGIIKEFASAQQARLKAHEAYLRFSENISKTVADLISLHISLQKGSSESVLEYETEPRAPINTAVDKPAPLFDRGACLEFARGSVAKMLGDKFAEVDTFPTRVRLPDEPLMLVDRITLLEGEPLSMSHGRVVTEHDILPRAWYLDGNRIPTCIAVEAGQADLFLSGYLGIDFITKGLAVYRLLDAVVTFHSSLPEPGKTISYDIHIERFFQQGDTRLFRFFFEASVDGKPLLSMREGCAGFFTETELNEGKGVVRTALDTQPAKGKKPADWQKLAVMQKESYSEEQLNALRKGDLAKCFGAEFADVRLNKPLTIPDGKMELVHRVIEVIPDGGRYGEGFIRAEADIRPDDWFITCHFVDDRVMPGTLMYECCMHTLRIFLLRMGWIAEANEGAVWEPVPGVASRLRCRGQVLETTKTVTYEVTIKELGYRPEPYAIADAMMYADGKPIVEICDMSVRLSGTTKEKLLSLWSDKNKTYNSNKPAIYTKEQILALSNGKPSEGFGDKYRIFDTERKIARLPGPPFQFIDRITAAKGDPWEMKAGAEAEAQYDIPSDAWYFEADSQKIMPFSVLLEAALQPCGWLAAYAGSALTSPVDLSFRNLGGNAVQHRIVTPETGTITASAAMKKVATSGGMIIQEYDFSISDSAGVLYEGETTFGFFSKDALAKQVGIKDAALYNPSSEELAISQSIEYPTEWPFHQKELKMIDKIDIFIPDGGEKSLGYIRGTKAVDPEEWFFKAHFFEDPVTPGSLGLESFVQLLKFAAFKRWGMKKGEMFQSPMINMNHKWLYRGQIIPSNNSVTVEAIITSVDDQKRQLTGDGLLSVDNKVIYQMKDFSLSIG